jgi:hypothetical protein
MTKDINKNDPDSKKFYNTKEDFFKKFRNKFPKKGPIKPKNVFSSRKTLQGGAEVLLIGCLVVVLLVIGAGVLVGGYLGFIPAVGKILGVTDTKDLGIKYQDIDTMALNKRMGVYIVKSQDSTQVANGLVLEGKVPVSTSLTSEQISAFANTDWKYYPFSNVQIRVNANNTVEASGYLKMSKIFSFTQALGFQDEDVRKAMDEYKIPTADLPMYAKGTLSVTDNKLDLNITSLTVKKIPVPSAIIAKAVPGIVSATESIISNLPGVDIQSLTFTDGKMNYKGTIPGKQTILTE